MRILVTKEKYGVYYYDVNDDVKLHKVCCKILKERLEEGWYGKEEPLGFDYVKSELGLTEAEINALPNGKAKDSLLLQVSHLKIRATHQKGNNNFINRIKNCVESPYDPKAKEAKRTMAYGLLRSRRDYEY